MITWIPTTPNPDGSLTIKGKTYRDDTEHEIYKGYVLMNDENHFGSIYFTAEMAEKYKLEGEKMDEDEYEEWIELNGDTFKHYTHNLFVCHYYGAINGDGVLHDGFTPFGQPYSFELFCYMNGIDPAFFEEDEKDVLVWSWGDG